MKPYVFQANKLAIENYQRFPTDFNRHLRTLQCPGALSLWASDMDTTQVELIDELFAKAPPLNKPVTVYRGEVYPLDINIDILLSARSFPIKVLLAPLSVNLLQTNLQSM